MPCSDRPPFACRYETDAVPLQIHEPVGHFEYTVLLVLAGGADAAITHRTYRLRRGSLLFIGRLEATPSGSKPRLTSGMWPGCPWTCC